VIEAKTIFKKITQQLGRDAEAKKNQITKFRSGNFRRAYMAKGKEQMLQLDLGLLSAKSLIRTIKTDINDITHNIKTN
jgi:hypothetical protein